MTNSVISPDSEAEVRCGRPGRADRANKGTSGCGEQTGCDIRAPDRSLQERSGINRQGRLKRTV